MLKSPLTYRRLTMGTHTVVGSSEAYAKATCRANGLCVLGRTVSGSGLIELGIGQDLFTMMQKTLGKEDYFTKNVLKLGSDMIGQIDQDHKRLSDFVSGKVGTHSIVPPEDGSSHIVQVASRSIFGWVCSTMALPLGLSRPPLGRIACVSTG